MRKKLLKFNIKRFREFRLSSKRRINHYDESKSQQLLTQDLFR